jgi:hypothetical protein
MDSQQSTQQQPQQQQPNFQYFIETWSVDNGSTTLSFSTTVPQYYTLRKLASGTVNPNTGDGSFTIDDNIFQVTGGTSSIGGGYGLVTYATGRDALLIQTLLTTTGAILPSSYTDSKGILYVVAPTAPLWLQAVFEAQNPTSLGLQPGRPVASSYYQPADTQLQICKPSMLPNIHQILVYCPKEGVYVTYVQKAHNGWLSWISDITSIAQAGYSAYKYIKSKI